MELPYRASSSEAQTAFRRFLGHPRFRAGLLGALLGEAVALVLVAASAAFAEDGAGYALLAAGVGGALAGAVGAPLLAWVRSRHPALGRAIGAARLRSMRLGPDGVAAEVTLDDTARAAAWPVFVALATRVAANSLVLRTADEDEPTGELGKALASLHSLFELAREKLQGSYDPGVALLGAKGNREPLETWVLAAINREIRPFQARWHPWLDRWKDTGLPEERWPGFEACRADLERVRLGITKIVVELAKVYDVEPALLSAKASAEGWARLPEGLGWGWGTVVDQALQQARVAVLARAPSRTVSAGRAPLQALLASWRELAGTLDELLKALPPIPAQVRLRPQERRPEEQVVAYREVLETALLEWEGRAAAWTDETDAQELARCAAALDETRSALRVLAR